MSHENYRRKFLKSRGRGVTAAGEAECKKRDACQMHTLSLLSCAINFLPLLWALSSHAVASPRFDSDFFTLSVYTATEPLPTGNEFNGTLQFSRRKPCKANCPSINSCLISRCAKSWFIGAAGYLCVLTLALHHQSSVFYSTPRAKRKKEARSSHHKHAACLMLWSDAAPFSFSATV